MDMLNCPATVKPHIVSPAMKLMMEDFAEGDEEFLNPTPIANRVLLPKLPTTIPITLSPLNLPPVQSVSAPSTVKYESNYHLLHFVKLISYTSIMVKYLKAAVTTFSIDTKLLVTTNYYKVTCISNVKQNSFFVSFIKM
jgi:hypothetical protein